MTRLDELLKAFPKGFRGELADALVTEVERLRAEVERLRAELGRARAEWADTKANGCPVCDGTGEIKFMSRTLRCSECRRQR